MFVPSVTALIRCKRQEEMAHAFLIQGSREGRRGSTVTLIEARGAFTGERRDGVGARCVVITVVCPLAALVNAGARLAVIHCNRCKGEEHVARFLIWWAALFIGAVGEILPGHEFLHLIHAVERPDRNKVRCGLSLRECDPLPHVPQNLRLGPRRAPETHLRHVANKLVFVVEGSAHLVLLLPKHDTPRRLDLLALKYIGIRKDEDSVLVERSSAAPMVAA